MLVKIPCGISLVISRTTSLRNNLPGGENCTLNFTTHTTETLDKGDVGYVPTGFGHSIENDSDNKPARVLIGFNTGHYQAIDLSLWLAANPDYLLEANFGQQKSVIDKLPRRRVFITGKDGPAK